MAELSSKILTGYDVTKTRPPHRKYFPFVDDSLAVMLGIEERVRKSLVEDGKPLCGKCGGRGETRRFTDFGDPYSSGIFALALPPLEFGDVEEWRALFDALGVQYLVADNLLRTVDEVDQCRGLYPVVFTGAVATSQQLENTIAEWLRSHGGSLTLFHFEARTEAGKLLGVLNALPVCSACGLEIQPLEGGDFAQGEKDCCEECGGKGWLERPHDLVGEFVCGKCFSTGLPSRIAGGEWRGIEVRRLAEMSVGDLVSRLADAEVSHRFISLLEKTGFAAYPAGFRSTWFCAGEYMRFALLSLMHLNTSSETFNAWEDDLSDPTIGVAVKSFSESCNTVIPIFGAGRIGDFEPEIVAGTKTKISLRNIAVGPLVDFSIEFPTGRMSLLVGPSGSGKTLILRSGLYGAFSSRKKFAAQVAFPGITTCVYVSGAAHIPETRNIGELVGVRSQVSQLFASSRRSRLAGFTQESFEGRRAEHLCKLCDGRGYAEDGEVCAVCQGLGLFLPVIEVEFAGITFGELMRHPFEGLRKLDWLPKGLALVAEVAANSDLQDASLVTQTRGIAFPKISALKVVGELAKVYRADDRPGINRKKTSVGLVLADAIFSRVSPHDGSIIARVLNDLCALGNTVVCAERNEVALLQSYSPHVVGLSTEPVTHTKLAPPWRTRVNEARR